MQMRLPSLIKRFIESSDDVLREFHRRATNCWRQSQHQIVDRRETVALEVLRIGQERMAVAAVQLLQALAPRSLNSKLFPRLSINSGLAQNLCKEFLSGV